MKGTETHDGIVPAIGEMLDGKIEKKTQRGIIYSKLKKIEKTKGHRSIRLPI